jgi:Protein of unknown function (DUF1559)
MKRISLGCLTFLVLALCLAPFEVPRAIILGWLLFLLRTLPRMTVDWPSVFVGCLALVLFTLGIHGAGRAWRRTAGDAPRWKIRWSLAAVAVVFLLFAAGISLVGIVHQASWLFTSPGPYYVQTIPWAFERYSPNNLRQIALAMQNYNETYDGKGPAGGTFTAEGEMLHSWETYCLVFIGYSTSDSNFSSSGIDFNLPWNHPRNRKYFQSILPVFTNSLLPTPPVLDEQGFGLSHYAANIRVLGPNKPLCFTDITDGTANTFLVGEINAGFKPWGHPVNWRDPAKGINRSPQGFGGPPFGGGVYFCMVDGSVRFVSERIEPKVLQALSTPAGGEEFDVSILGSSR